MIVSPSMTRVTFPTRTDCGFRAAPQSRTARSKTMMRIISLMESRPLLTRLSPRSRQSVLEVSFVERERLHVAVAHFVERHCKFAVLRASAVVRLGEFESL